jgi:hypothetical protein
LLNDYFKAEKKLVLDKYVEQGLRLGSFQTYLIKALISDKQYKKEIPLWEQQYPDLFEELRRRVIKKTERPRSDNTELDHKIDLLNSIFIEEKKLPIQTYIHNDIKIGSFKNTLIQALTKENIYKKEIPIWEQKYILLFKTLRSIVESNKKKTKCDITPDDKIRIVNDYFETKGELLVSTYIVNDIKLGQFQMDLIQSMKGNSTRFKKYKNIWSEKYPELFKQLRIRVEKSLETPTDTRPLDDKIKLLNEYFIEYKELPTRDFVYNDVKIGNFQTYVLNAITSVSKYKEESYITHHILRYNAYTI